MKSKIGKITMSAMVLVITVLLTANLVITTRAVPVNPRVIPTIGNAQLQGDIWYVDGNMNNDGGNGKSWDSAKKYLSSAMALSHADIARSADRQWAGRNTIYVKGDSITEDLTALAQKTDIIGVGSDDAQTQASLIGTIIVDSTVNYVGCRFYNMSFQDDGGAVALVDVDGQTGLQFIGCYFLVNPSDNSTYGLQASDASWLVVKDCWFGALSGADIGFATACIVYDQDNPAYGVRIEGNYFQGEVGIDWNETTVNNINIVGNQFSVQAMWLDTDDLAGIQVYNNFGTTVVSEVDNTGSDFNILYAGNNVICGSGGPALIPSY